MSVLQEHLAMLRAHERGSQGASRLALSLCLPFDLIDVVVSSLIKPKKCPKQQHHAKTGVSLCLSCAHSISRGGKRYCAAMPGAIIAGGVYGACGFRKEQKLA